jgi:cytoskeletal protein RodZ
MSNFLSGIAVILSILALGFSGFTAYQVFTLQEKIAAISSNASTGTSGTSQPETITPVSSAASDTTATAPAATSGIQPGQFVQSAIGNKAKLELLAVKRITDPEAKTRDVVNVQMRIRRLTSEVSPSDAINVAGTKARNPDTSETYEPVDYKRSSGSVNLYFVRKNASSDAYVWLRIPEGVTAIDLFIPDTGAFKNVPIAS